MTQFRRHLFHHEGVTDIRKMREDAQESARKGEPVLLHLHPYEEFYDGCGPTQRRVQALHETFEEAS